MVKIQPVPSEGPDSQDKSFNQANENGGNDLKSNGQEPDAHMNSPRNDSQKDEATHGMDHLLKEGSNDDEALDPATPISQQGQNPPHPRVSYWKHRASHPLDNIISSFDQGITTRSKVCMHSEGPSSKNVNRAHTRQKFTAPWELTRDKVPQTGQHSQSFFKLYL
ncbi:hypothetical protein HAX54_046297 [Datura stramonium]|uniref:Uncharacterized protein n=1 Tax=Datura stramonium TaxID=4076 RepID=A0ABS8SR52_DATST|nr:hypothetical protein [Datura stramonium]